MVQIPSPLCAKYNLLVGIIVEFCKKYKSVLGTALRSPGNVAAIMFVTGGGPMSCPALVTGHLIADTLVLRMGKTSYRRRALAVQTGIFCKFETFIAFQLTFSCE